MLRAFLSQSILHALVAALVVEALLRAWKVGDAAWRLRFRLLALAAPLLWLPALFFFAPFRSSPSFVAHAAIFAGERWNLVSIRGTGLGDLILLLAAGVGFRAVSTRRAPAHSRRAAERSACAKPRALAGRGPGGHRDRSEARRRPRDAGAARPRDQGAGAGTPL